MLRVLCSVMFSCGVESFYVASSCVGLYCAVLCCSFRGMTETYFPVLCFVGYDVLFFCFFMFCIFSVVVCCAASLILSYTFTSCVMFNVVLCVSCC